jgi:hypothetical protein
MPSNRTARSEIQMRHAWIFNWQSTWFWGSIGYSIGSTLVLWLLFKCLQPETNSVLKRIAVLSIFLGLEAGSAILYFLALNDQPIYDFGFVVTYFLPVLLFVIVATLTLVVFGVFLTDFMSLSRCRHFVPALFLGTVIQIAFALAYGSPAGFALCGVGLVENIAKILTNFKKEKLHVKVD